MLQFTMVYEIYRNMKYLSTIKGQELQTNLKIKNSKQSLPHRQILMELELEFLELKLHNKLEFEELKFLNSGRLQHILANSGIWPIWPTNFAII